MCQYNMCARQISRKLSFFVSYVKKTKKYIVKSFLKHYLLSFLP
jgi:hypothetical protein